MEINPGSREKIISKLKTICNGFSDILGVVILFGSYSRGDYSASSDIDLYIEPKDINMTSARFWKNKRYKEFEYALYDSFPCELDLISYGGKKDLASMKKSPLWKQIEKDGVRVYDQRAKAV